MSSAAKRIPSLDGLRAVSIGLVLLGHLITSGTAHWADRLWRFDLGVLGVRAFFVISGFLITNLLLAEMRATGTISLRAFYFRRFLRIMPAYWTMLAVAAAAAALGLVELSPKRLAAAFLYVSNYADMNWTLGHTWSLSVEEQFYLLWPPALLALGPRRATRLLAALLLLSPALRALAAATGFWPDNPKAFEMVCDALAAGCGLALLREPLWNRPWYRAALSSAAFWALPALAVGLTASGVSPVIRGALVLPLLNLALAATIDKVIRAPESPAGRLLNARPLVIVGTLSYSIYLWQQFFLGDAHPIPFPLNLALVAAAATASYALVEKPALAARERVLSTARRLTGARAPAVRQLVK